MQTLTTLFSALSLALLVGCASTNGTAPKPDHHGMKACCADCGTDACKCACCSGEAGCKGCAMMSKGESCPDCAAKDGAVCADCAAGGEAHCAECAAAKTQPEPAAQAAGPAPGSAPGDDTNVATIQASGMSCPLCASNADRRLKKLDGVEWVNVDLGKGEVKVGLAADGKRPTEKQLSEAILDAGFTPNGVTMPAQ